MSTYVDGYRYRIVLDKLPSPSKGPPPNFDSSVVCEVLRVTTHHAKFLDGDSKVHSLSSHRLFWWVSGVPLHLVAKFAHTSRSLIHSVLRLQHKISVLQATNAVKQWQRDFRLVCFVAGYSLLYCHAGLVCLKKEARVKLQCESIQ